ncbi:hypothetical protein J2848_003575 [Azospirillum lipoferum]|uniref:Uncharacterized protein n=1 Tax=Azospirillum lipoferum TaxID=193 RepID=A0A5A9GL88_AZOLI|nr:MULTISPECIES: hypothetical protein [Azospirillum]KAA0595230.1 hypothetical protein FZ942_16440 [Azospirillum lipoferum]MCP1611897.1 hypothetical protein [Azospirillum lipoferum]MDW5533344.1 hypothetical protein [Azospirillum sp. NL1]
MMSPRTVLLPTVAALLLTAGTAAAQVTGGIAFPPGPIPGAAMAQAFSQTPRLPVSVNPTPRGAPPGAMVTNPSVRRSTVNQQAITRIRGDAGYLAGFNKGQPLAASRQPPVQPVDPSFTIIDAPFIVNNFNSALNFAFGDGNISQQQLGDGTTGSTTGPVEAAAPAPAPEPAPVPAPTAKPAGPSTLDMLMSTAGPLPHLPAALAHGGVQFNNVNTTTNTAVGKGNRATQTTVTVQR